MRHPTKPPLVQIRACCLFGAKPLSEQILAYCQLGPWEHVSVKSTSKYDNFHWRKWLWKCPMQNVGQYVKTSCKGRLTYGRMSWYVSWPQSAVGERLRISEHADRELSCQPVCSQGYDEYVTLYGWTVGWTVLAYSYLSFVRYSVRCVITWSIFSHITKDTP